MKCPRILLEKNTSAKKKIFLFDLDGVLIDSKKYAGILGNFNKKTQSKCSF